VAALKLRVLLFDLEATPFERLQYEPGNFDGLVEALQIRVMLYNLSRPPVGRSYQEQYDLLRTPDSMRALEDLRARLARRKREVALNIGELSDIEQRFIANFPRVRALFKH
jgi:hypothetical protein